MSPGEGLSAVDPAGRRGCCGRKAEVRSRPFRDGRFYGRAAADRGGRRTSARQGSSTRPETWRNCSSLPMADNSSPGRWRKRASGTPPRAIPAVLEGGKDVRAERLAPAVPPKQVRTGLGRLCWPGRALPLVLPLGAGRLDHVDSSPSVGCQNGYPRADTLPIWSEVNKALWKSNLAPVAQGIEHRFPKPRVAGSNPAGRSEASPYPVGLYSISRSCRCGTDGGHSGDYLRRGVRSTPRPRSAYPEAPWRSGPG